VVVYKYVYDIIVVSTIDYWTVVKVSQKSIYTEKDELLLRQEEEKGWKESFRTNRENNKEREKGNRKPMGIQVRDETLRERLRETPKSMRSSPWMMSTLCVSTKSVLIDG
jgi:hypothetical protein